MKEKKFIEQNKSKWLQFESLYSNKKTKKNPEELSDLFIDITDDLAYARTYYPNRSVRVYLNKLAGSVFMSIYTVRKTKWNRLKDFWVNEIPTIVYHSRKDLLLSLLVFTLAVAIGAFSTYLNPDFTREILGDQYVNMTLENIKKNDPMAVYKGENEIAMFLGITLNNIFVAFYTFLYGALFLVGSLAILLYNGVMVGTFQYFFYQHNLFIESSLTIWLHGTIEILSIIIAGGAGMVMGRGFMFPGTLSRWQAFQLSAKKGIKIMIGIVPLFIIAGFIEGFITRHTEMPNAIKLGFILLCFGFMLFYFVYLPYRKRHSTLKLEGLERLEEEEKTAIDFKKIYPAGEMVSNAFRLFVKKGWSIVLFHAIISLFTSLLFILLIDQEDPLIADSKSYMDFSIYMTNVLFGIETSFTLRMIFTIVFTIIICGTSYYINQIYRPESQVTFWKEFTSTLFVKALLFFLGFHMIFYLESNWGIFFILLVIPIVYYLLVNSHVDEDRKAISKIWDSFGANLPSVIIMAFFIFFLGIVLYSLTANVIMTMIVDRLYGFFSMSTDEYEFIRLFVTSFVANMVILLLLSFYHIISTLSYFSNKEKNTGQGMKSKLKSLFP